MSLSLYMIEIEILDQKQSGLKPAALKAYPIRADDEFCKLPLYAANGHLQGRGRRPNSPRVSEFGHS
jgi:hypothetical protein